MRSEPLRRSPILLRGGRRDGAAAAQGQRIRSGVELVSLNVTATDGQGKYTTDLNEEEFEVYEDGAKQKLTFFSKTAAADLAGAPARHQREHGRAHGDRAGSGHRLRQAAAQGGPGEVIDFDSQVRVLAEFTNDAAALEKAIRTTTPNGSTSLYNALYIALKELKKVEDQRRPTSAGRRSCCCPTATTRLA